MDEACTSFLVPARPVGADAPPAETVETMELSYDRFPRHLHVTIRAKAPRGWPERDELGWAMLGSLVGEVRMELRADGIGVLTLVEPLPMR